MCITTLSCKAWQPAFICFYWPYNKFKFIKKVINCECKRQKKIVHYFIKFGEGRDILFKVLFEYIESQRNIKEGFTWFMEQFSILVTVYTVQIKLLYTSINNRHYCSNVHAFVDYVQYKNEYLKSYSACFLEHLVLEPVHYLLQTGVEISFCRFNFHSDNTHTYVKEIRK